jgi:hypothetical protein
LTPRIIDCVPGRCLNVSQKGDVLIRIGTAGGHMPISPSTAPNEAVRRRIDHAAEMGCEGKERPRHGVGDAITGKEGVVANPARCSERATQQRQHHVAAAKYERARPIECVEQGNPLRSQQALQNRQTQVEEKESSRPGGNLGGSYSPGIIELGKAAYAAIAQPTRCILGGRKRGEGSLPDRSMQTIRRSFGEPMTGIVGAAGRLKVKRETSAHTH